jgi:hypothetical protein
LGDEIGLNDDHHVLAKGYFSGVVTSGGFGLKDRRILIHAMDQVVVDAVAALMNNLRRFFGFGGRRSVFNYLSQGFEAFDGGVMHRAPLRCGPFTDRKSPVNLAAIA